MTAKNIFDLILIILLWSIFIYGDYQMTVREFRLKTFGLNMLLLFSNVALFFIALYFTVKRFG